MSEDDSESRPFEAPEEDIRSREFCALAEEIDP
jgi:hypothetical protein